MTKFILLMVVCSGIPGNECKPISPTLLQSLILIMNVFILVMIILHFVNKMTSVQE